MWYQQLRVWSPTHDAYVHRISIANAHGHELFILLIEDCDRRTLRARKAAAAEALYACYDEVPEGIDPEPGEVKVSPAQWARMVHQQLAAMNKAEQPKVWRPGMTA